MSTPKRGNPVAGIMCFIYLIATFIAFNPGFLTSDSLAQYEQALSGRYEDWHPPVMAFVWRILNHIYTGPQVMLALQLIFLSVSIYLLTTVFKNTFWRVLCFIFAVSPFVLNYAGNIFKDTQMALAWLLAFSILFRKVASRENMGYAAALGTLVLILYGTWVRPNGLPGAMPLLFLWTWLVMQNRPRKIFIVSSIVLVIIVALLTPFFSGKAFHAQKQYADNKIYMYDLGGIFVATGEDVYPGALYDNPDFDTAYIRKNYTPATYDNIWWNNDGKNMKTPGDSSMNSQLRLAWLKAIKTHPGIYLENRYEGFLYFLRIKKRDITFYSASPWVAENKYGFKSQGHGFYEVFNEYIYACKDAFFMRPWFWFFLNFLLAGLTPFVKPRRLKVFYFVLTLSALLYILPQFLYFQIDNDFRYWYWNCIAEALALNIFIYSVTTGHAKNKLPA